MSGPASPIAGKRTRFLAITSAKNFDHCASYALLAMASIEHPQISELWRAIGRMLDAPSPQEREKPS